MFDAKLAKTSPESAARTILRGVSRNRARTLIGADAKFLDLVVRVFGSGYQKLVVAGTTRAMPAPATPPAPAAAAIVTEMKSSA